MCNFFVIILIHFLATACLGKLGLQTETAEVDIFMCHNKEENRICVTLNLSYSLYTAYS